MIKKIRLFLIVFIASFQVFSQWTYFEANASSGLTQFYLDPQENILYIGDIEGFRFYNIDTDIWTDITEDGVIGKETRCITSHPSVAGRIVTGRVDPWFKGYMGLTNDWGNTEEQVFESDGGVIQDVKFCPTNPDIMYACGWSDITPGDLLKSVDGGQSWSQLSGYIHQAMTEVALHPTNPDILYVSGDAKITKSIDGGNSWSVSNAGLPSNYGVYCVSINPFNPEELLCSNDIGLYKTTDAGASWIMKKNVSVSFISYNPVYQNYVAAITFSPYTVFLSSDAGETWNDITNSFPGQDMRDVVFSKDGTELYVLSKYGFYSTNIDFTGITQTYSNPNFHFTNYPNPFKDFTTITYTLTNSNDAVEIRIENNLGQEISRIKSMPNAKGNNAYQLNRLDIQGKALTSGLYYCSMYVNGDKKATIKLIVI